MTRMTLKKTTYYLPLDTGGAVEPVSMLNRVQLALIEDSRVSNTLATHVLGLPEDTPAPVRMSFGACDGARARWNYLLPTRGTVEYEGRMVRGWTSEEILLVITLLDVAIRTLRKLAKDAENETCAWDADRLESKIREEWSSFYGAVTLIEEGA